MKINSFLYIGQYSEGTTSRMRANQLVALLKPNNAEIIDTHVPFLKTNKLIRSFGFRYKLGPLIKTVNDYIQQNLKSEYYDLIWVDKGVYIKPNVLAELKRKAGKIIHYTPDMAFYENNSRYFEETMKDYDYCITTKTAEIKEYLKRIPESKLLITTQGFSKDIHKPFHQFKDKDDAVVFIGLAEPHRFRILEKLLQAGINIKLVGKKWESFLEQHKHCEHLTFLGNSIYDEEYGKLISSSKFSVGLLSKRFLEFHTTRTLEIPACGTALLTEKNQEIASYYNDNEVIFYKDPDDLVKKIKYYLNHSDELEKLINRGKHKVYSNGYDYESILGELLKRILNKDSTVIKS